MLLNSKRYRKFQLLVFALTAAPLAANCFNAELGGRLGYRNDQLCHTIYSKEEAQDPIFKEDFDNLSAVQVTGFANLRVFWIEVDVDADYGWTVDGSTQSTLFIESGPQAIKKAPFKSDPSGEVWDAFFTGGLHIPLYSCCDHGLSVTPLGGYSFHGIREKRRNIRPLSQNIGETEDIFLGISDPTFVSISRMDILKRDYRGPFTGVGVSFHYCYFFTNFGYTYHFIDLDQEVKFQQTIETYFPDGTITLSNYVQSQFEPDRNRGNRAWISLNYRDPCGFRLGLQGTYFSVATGKKNNGILSQSSPPFGDDQFTKQALAQADWRSFTVMLEGAFSF